MISFVLKKILRRLCLFLNKNKSMVDGHKKVNLSTIKNPSLTFINANLSPKEERSYIELIMKYQDIFASSYDEMLGLNLKVAIH